MMGQDRNHPIQKTEAARRAGIDFERRYEEQLKQEKNVAFNILVWGMSPAKDKPIAKKRNDIRDQLIEDGHNAMFSEELTHLGDDRGHSEKSKEFAQAKSVDLIIILIEDSPGALAEACDFCNHPDLASKIYIMAPDSYKDGYAGQGALKELDDGYGGVYWYQKRDVEVCHLLKQACKRVRARRSMIYRHKTRESN